VATEQEQLEREIFHTRQQLGQDVDALTEKVSPTQAARRGVGRARSALVSAKDAVMGTAGDAAGTTKDRAAQVGHGVADTAGQVRDSAGEMAQTAGEQVRRQTEGNPLAAGLIAFGIGWLASSIIPASRPEQRVGEALRDAGQDTMGTVRDEVTSAARDVADNLKEPAQQAAQTVRERATDAASTVKDEGASQAQDLSGKAQKAAEAVRDDARTGDQANGRPPGTPPLT
jgi:uncharacterized protein YoxC